MCSCTQIVQFSSQVYIFKGKKKTKNKNPLNDNLELTRQKHSLFNLGDFILIIYVKLSCLLPLSFFFFFFTQRVHGLHQRETERDREVLLRER